jgi:hypothetical protein
MEFKKDTVEEIITRQSSSISNACAPQCDAHLVLGAFDGYVSAYNMQTAEIMWHYKKPENSEIDHFLSTDFSKCGEKVTTLQKIT